MDKLANFNIKGKILEKLVTPEKNNSTNDIIMPGVVVSNYDPQNNKRIKVRIPIVDDHYFVNNKDGIDDLPWCLPINKRFVDVPDEKTTVLIITFNVGNSKKCRLYLDVFDIIDNIDIFEPEKLIIDKENNWEDAEKQIGREYQTGNDLEKYKYKNNKKEKRVGIKGKFKNDIILDEKEIILHQNKGENNESNLILGEKFKVNAYKELELLSKKSNKKKKPIFAEDFLDLFKSTIDLLSAIEKILTTSPSTSTAPGTLSAANPASSVITTSLQSLKLQYENFKIKGISENILIN